MLAALLAERRDLPGPRPNAIVSCQHKPTSRAVQQLFAPEAVPRFAVLEDEPSLDFPFFVKPVVGRLSQGAVRVETPSDLERLAVADGYTSRYAEIAALAGADPESVRGFLAEELLSGAEVTLEGYVHGGRVTSIGVTDSVKYPGTNSFERFEYPSVLPRERQDELGAVAERVLPSFGFDGGFFNVEFFVPEEGPAQIIEVNARLASQFSPLMEATHGRSTYDALFALACGDDPEWRPGPPRGVGVSYCLRAFADALVLDAPAPSADLEVLVQPGRRLSEQGVNDAWSYRLAILHAWGETREEAVDACYARARALDFRLEPELATARRA